MTPFFWAHGHIGWPLFAIAAFSAICVLVADVIWRTRRTRFRNVAIGFGMAWAAGVIVIGAMSL